MEAANMDQARSLARPFATLTVPEVVLATKHVLVQTLAPGCSIRDADRSSFTERERVAIGTDLLAMTYRGFFVDRIFHADPHPGNIFVHPGEQASLIDWGMVGRIDRRTSMMILLVLMNLAQNDGHGLAKAWTELGHATPWADLGGFATDMAALTPRIATASLAELNFGVTLTAVLQRSTKRGIKTTPLISLLGKAFANVEGSVRYLAPELSLTDVFREQLTPIMVQLLGEFLSHGQAVRTVMELMVGSGSVIEEARTVLRDLATREFAVQVVHEQRHPDERTRTFGRGLLLLAGLVIWLDLRHRGRTTSIT
jgi:ubiquinone biosynthesis protein